MTPFSVAVSLGLAKGHKRNLWEVCAENGILLYVQHWELLHATYWVPHWYFLVRYWEFDSQHARLIFGKSLDHWLQFLLLQYFVRHLWFLSKCDCVILMPLWAISSSPHDSCVSLRRTNSSCSSSEEAIVHQFSSCFQNISSEELWHRLAVRKLPSIRIGGDFTTTWLRSLIICLTSSAAPGSLKYVSLDL